MIKAVISDKWLLAAAAVLVLLVFWFSSEIDNMLPQERSMTEIGR